MTFTTFTFVLFLTLVCGVYWMLGRRAQNLLLLVSSYFFYGWWDYRFCALMLISSVVDYWVAIGLDHFGRRSTRRWLLGVSLGVNLGMLGFFKYVNFFAENLTQLLGSLGWQTDPLLLEVVLPVGISFYTFQTLSYTLDTYFGKIRSSREFIAYMAYVSFFPQLVAGPIERAARLLPQFLAERRFDYTIATDGGRQILWGFVKKMVIADNLAMVVDAAYRNPAAAGGLPLAFATVCFAFQIYCDFSGYSDIAIGTAKLFGIDLMRNFANPYFSQDVAEFWRRWHISLSTWFRDYVFIPLGGSRGGRWTTAWNIMITFVVSGFWHGASWTFIVWGALNGLAMLPGVFRAGSKRAKLGSRDTPGGEGLVAGPATVARILTTFAFACLTWVFFRAATIGDAMVILRSIGGDALSSQSWIDFGTYFSRLARGGPLMIHLGIFVAVEWLQRRRHHALDLDWPRPLRWLVYTVLLYDLVGFGTYGQNSFIYFQF